MSIVGSAGAFEPLRCFLSQLPPSLDAAVLVTLHTGEGSLLADALRARSALPVCSATSGQVLEAGHVYVAAPGFHVIVNPDGRVALSNAPRVKFFRPSADWLLTTAAASYGSRHVAVVLSGMLSDGAAALCSVKRNNGTVLAQSPGDALYDQMPAAAIATGCVDRHLPASELARAVCDELSKHDRSADSASWEHPFDLALAFNS